MSEEEQSEAVSNVSTIIDIYYWTFIETLGNAVFSATFAFLGTALLFLLGYISEYRIIMIVPVLIFMIMLFRNNIVTKIFTWRSNYAFSKFVNSLSKILILIFIILLITFLEGLLSTNIFYENTDALMFSIFCLYFPIYVAFMDALSEEGSSKIEFEQAKIHINNWVIRQRWFKKIFKRLENKLKLGLVKIPSDSIVNNINRMNSKEIETHLINIEEWTIGNQQDERIFLYLEEIINKEDITQIQNIPIMSRISKVSPEQIKYLVWLIIALIVILFRPEWVNTIIQNYPK